jgi:hypothetical protein
LPLAFIGYHHFLQGVVGYKFYIELYILIEVYPVGLWPIPNIGENDLECICRKGDGIKAIRVGTGTRL